MQYLLFLIVFSHTLIFIACRDYFFLTGSFKNNHKTKEFYRINRNLQYPILRRDNVFQFDLQNQHFVNYSKQLDSISVNIEFVLSNRSLRLKYKSGEWKLRVYKVKKRLDKLKFLLTIPSNAPIGVWNLTVSLKRHRYKALRLKGIDYMIVLFNPWSKNDDVHTERLDEFIQKQYTSYLSGNKIIRKILLNQFREVVLNATLKALRNSYLKGLDYCDVVKISRALTAMSNAKNAGGILHGNWKKPFVEDPENNERSSLFWTSSLQILDYYAKNSSVKYGQCFTFSSILASMHRSIGIPARIVTNIKSGHDENHDTIITKPKKSTGEFVWNFHVWVEVYMKRRDLGYMFNGWQAIDGSGALQSQKEEEYFQIGPCPILAVKYGYINATFNVVYFYAAVNGHEATRKNFKNGVIYIDSSNVIKSEVATIIDENKVILTDNYRVIDEKESSLIHKHIYFALNYTVIYTKKSSSAQFRSTMGKKYQILIETKGARFGKPLQFILIVKKLTRSKEQCNLKYVVYSLMNTDTIGNTIKSGDFNVSNYTKTDFHEEARFNVVVNASEYGPKLIDILKIRIAVELINSKNDEYITEIQNVWLKLPKMEIEKKKEMINIKNKWFAKYSGLIAFVNPLPYKLRNFTMTAIGIQFGPYYNFVKNLDENHMKKVHFNYVDYQNDTEFIIASVYSPDLHTNIREYLNITL